MGIAHFVNISLCSSIFFQFFLLSKILPPIFPPDLRQFFMCEDSTMLLNDLIALKSLSDAHKQLCLRFASIARIEKNLFFLFSTSELLPFSSRRLSPKVDENLMQLLS